VTKRLLKGINRRQMNLVGVQTIVLHINYTITKLEFTSINVRMMFPNMKIVTSSGPVRSVCSWYW